MKARAWCGLCVIALSGATFGCGGNYTIVFTPERIINADADHPNDDLSAEMLDVDVIALTPADARAYPGILNGTMRADDWFAARDRRDGKLENIDSKRIYALRHGGASEKADNLVGPPLLPGRDLAENAPRTREVRIEHPNPGDKDAAIVIYGKFKKGAGVASVEPLIIQPPPTWGKDTITVNVGRTGMSIVSVE